MTPVEAARIAGSLGFPTKMPGTSYGLSAHDCITGGKLAAIEGSTCHDCYAMKGHYVYANVAKAHAKRLAAISDPLWTDAMVTMLHHAHVVRLPKRRDGTPIAVGYHRWHDSGDLQSVEHLDKIVEIARRLPQIKFWLPTRELTIVREWMYTKAKGGVVRVSQVIPNNLLIRVSSTMVDDKPRGAWPWTSTVHDQVKPFGRTCPAPTQGNECRACRACWSAEIANVSYHKH
jgi:hypothetical protein